MTWCAHGGISKIFFLAHFSPSFLGQNIIEMKSNSSLKLWIFQMSRTKFCFLWTLKLPNYSGLNMSRTLLVWGTEGGNLTA